MIWSWNVYNIMSLRRSKERLIYFCIYILPTLCFLVTLLMYTKQQRYYNQRLQSIATIFKVDLSDVNMRELEKNLTFVQNGGWYKPTNCTCHSDKKVAIIIPYRDRYKHLGVFLRYMHPFLKNQEIHYRIFIIEQANKKLFNRAKLMNIGFIEAGKIDNFNCFVFHDIDLLPLCGGNDYSCPTSPRHMSVAVDTMDFSAPYEDIFGGVSAIRPEHFKAVNGYPNRYWGWGGEDDDISERLRAAGYRITSPSSFSGIYTMMYHTHSVAEEFPERYKTLKKWQEHKDTDGLNTIKYEVLQRKDFQLYTMISCNV